VFIETSISFLKIFSQRYLQGTSSREFPTPLNFRTTPPASGGKEGKGREGKGSGEKKGRDPQGLVDTPMFQILKNTLKSSHQQSAK